MNKTQKLSSLALTVAAAMLLSFIESRLPSFTAVPGIKVGLANIAVTFALYRIGTKEAALVSAVRVVLVSLLFGSPVSMLYGLAGAVLSLALMSLLKRISPLSPVGVSVAGGVAHNLGQIALACLLLRTATIFYYLPVLILTGTLAGIVTGVAAGTVIKRINHIG